MIEVILAAPMVTVQDTGRRGRRHLGVPRCGMLDEPALQQANLLLGNPMDAAGLEITFGPIKLKALTDHHIVLMGADMQATLSGPAGSASAGSPDPPALAASLPPGFVHPWPAGHTLHLTAAAYGRGRACLAIAGGIDVPLVLGSRSTDLINRFGGLDGRALITGDQLPVGRSNALPVPAQGLRQPAADGQLRIVPGPDYHDLDERGQQTLLNTRWQITSSSNRMGLRLDGPRLNLPDAGSRLSYGVLPGQIQVPADGRPIVLAADAQTTGGYPCVASVIGADLWQLAYLTPGASLTFTEIDLPSAHRLQQQHATRLQWLAVQMAKTHAVTGAPSADQPHIAGATREASKPERSKAMKESPS